MPFAPFHEVVPEVAAQETRTLFIISDAPEDPLAGAAYTLNELYCDEPDCDCRRVFLYVESSERPGPEAVIAWGWESPAFYRNWLCNPDSLRIDDLIGPALNFGSPQTELAEPLLALVTELLADDPAYAERIQAHYRLFRDRIDQPKRVTSKAPAAHASGDNPRGTPHTRVALRGAVVMTNLEAEVEPSSRAGLVEILREAGILVASEEVIPVIALEVDEDEDLIPPGETVFATDGENLACVRLASIPELFVGDDRPPPFGAVPPFAYQDLFFSIESAVYDYCLATGDRIRDKEMEQA